MAKVIAITNEKGGIGKTTTALALIQGMTKVGYKVLGIDLDGQRNCTLAMGAVPSDKNSFSMLLKECTAADAIQHTENGDIIPAEKALFKADAKLTDAKCIFALRDALKTVNDSYDYIILDTPPALGIITNNAMLAADYAVIPLKADLFSIQGLADLKEAFDDNREYFNAKVKIAGLLMTCYHDRENVSKEMAESVQLIADKFETKFFETKIRETVAVRAAQLSKANLFEYASTKTAAADYAQFIKELIETVGA